MASIENEKLAQALVESANENLITRFKVGDLRLFEDDSRTKYVPTTITINGGLGTGKSTVIDILKEKFFDKDHTLPVTYVRKEPLAKWEKDGRLQEMYVERDWEKEVRRKQMHTGGSIQVDPNNRSPIFNFQVMVAGKLK